MKPSDFQDTIRFQFDYLMKCVIDSTIKNYRQKIKKRSKYEIPFADLSAISLAQMGVMNEYSVESFCFDVEGIATVHIHNEELASALQKLNAKKRNIVLMFYCLEASDQEIAEVLKIDPSTSYRNRKSALEEIYKSLREG